MTNRESQSVVAQNRQTETALLADANKANRRILKGFYSFKISAFVLAAEWPGIVLGYHGRRHLNIANNIDDNCARFLHNGCIQISFSDINLKINPFFPLNALVSPIKTMR